MAKIFDDPICEMPKLDKVRFNFSFKYQLAIAMNICNISNWNLIVDWSPFE